MLIRRGDIFYVNLDPTTGSEQAGTRPVLIIQNDVSNQYAPTVIVAPLTTRVFSKPYPTNATVPEGMAGLRAQSTVLLSQIRTIDKRRLQRKVGHLPASSMQQVNEAIKVSLALE
ncbi:MAG: type II toxin-antitoxin system PemK/MazF family toxin [Candidatus Omnitrophica bacterium]|nr:type II toxin-antitoxin system PemK/MazF family toxin [Candidatus Omnitrophota bacterium]